MSKEHEKFHPLFEDMYPRRINPHGMLSDHVHIAVDAGFKSTKTKRSKTMPQFPRITVIEVKSHRSANIHLETAENTFVHPASAGGGTTAMTESYVAPGAEMPIWLTVPMDVYRALQNSSLA